MCIYITYLLYYKTVSCNSFILSKRGSPAVCSREIKTSMDIFNFNDSILINQYN